MRTKAIMAIFALNLSTSIIGSISNLVFKIFDSAYFQSNSKGYYRAQKQKTYCAPQILTNLNDKKLYPLYNYHSADTFSIGLVILYCMSLVNPLGAYSRKYQIDFYYIQSMFRLAERKGYNEQLINLVRLCLQPKNRQSVSEILMKLQNIKLVQKTSSNSSKQSLKKAKKYNASQSYFTSG